LIRADPEALGHSDQIGQRIGTHFAHDVPAMKLDRILGYLQVGCDLLIQQSGYYLQDDFLLARGKRLVPLSQVTHVRVPLSGTPIAFDGLLNCSQEILLVKRVLPSSTVGNPTLSHTHGIV
jgi:hypothetical protein